LEQGVPKVSNCPRQSRPKNLLWECPPCSSKGIYQGQGPAPKPQKKKQNMHFLEKKKPKRRDGRFKNKK
jgi:hypothetical protein